MIVKKLLDTYLMDLPLILASLTLLAGFYMSWNIGANDVANAMGTSVGSRALTLKRAVYLAALFEFLGALCIGSHVSTTIQSGIIDPAAFAADPMTFALGMLGSLLATGILLQIASYFGLPISTTHAIIGAVFGFGWLLGGTQAVQWGTLLTIATSWIFSPPLSALVSYGLFRGVKKWIFQTTNPILAAQKWIPSFAFLCIWTGSWSLLETNLPSQWSLLAALCCATLGSMVSRQWIRSFLFQPVYSSPSGSLAIGGVEKMFTHLQIMSACFVAFAHGGNDVANAIGPIHAVLQVIFPSSSLGTPVLPFWLLGFGGLGIILGLAMCGWRVIETIGAKITELTPTRGFCAELGTALTVLLASKWGLPISTTHALVGSIFGVGLAQGIQTLNFQMLKEIAFSWAITIPLCAFLSVIMFHLLRAVSSLAL